MIGWSRYRLDLYRLFIDDRAYAYRRTGRDLLLCLGYRVELYQALLQHNRNFTLPLFARGYWDIDLSRFPNCVSNVQVALILQPERILEQQGNAH